MAAHAAVIATPVHWYPSPSVLKLMIDRDTAFEQEARNVKRSRLTQTRHQSVGCPEAPPRLQPRACGQQGCGMDARRFLAKAAALLSVCLGPMVASAQPFYQGPTLDEVQLRVPLVRQDTMVWCWVASAKMVAGALGRRTPSQCEMLQAQYNAPCCSQPWLCHRPGHIAEIQGLIATFGLSTTELRYSGTARDLFETLQDTQAPLVAWVDRSHFVVITGMKIVPSPVGPTAIVRMNDPIRGRFDQHWAQFAPRLGAVLSVER